MKVIHVSTAATWRGGEQQITYLYDELNFQVKQWIICVEDSRMEDNCLLYGRRYHSHKKTSSLSFSFSKKLASMVKEHSIDLVHAHDSHAHTFCILASLLFGMKKPIIVHRRVDYPVSNSWFSRFKYNYPQIEKFICVSHEVKRVLDSSLRDPSKSTVIYSGIDTEKFQSADRDYLRNLLTRIEDETLIGNVAAITQQKDYFTFVEAAALIRKKKDKVHFVVIGDGDQRLEIEEYVREKGLKPDFTFLGYRDDVEELLPGLDILMFSSEKEGLGTTLIDALISEVPIASTNAGGIQELLENRKNALVVDIKDPDGLANAVIEIMENKELAQQLTDAGKDKAIDFDKHYMARNIYRVYREVLDEK